MKSSPVPFAGAVFLLCLVTVSPAPAGPVAWSYRWSADSLTVAADEQGGAFNLFLGQGSSTGTTNVIAANLEAVSTATPDRPDSFLKKPHPLTLHLKDGASQQEGTLTFSGRFHGTFSAQSMNVTYFFDSPQTQLLTLGEHVYSVTIGPYTAPGLPGSSARGAISALVVVGDVEVGPPHPVPSPPAAHAPEPSGLILAMVGSSLLGLAGWRTRRRQATL